MEWHGMTRIVVITAIVVIIVAIASFYGGMYISSTSAQRGAVTQILTITHQ
jgi:hypothetical protein